MHVGPVQLIAFVFDGVDRFKGQILRELDGLRGRGLIRIIDLLFIAKEQDGSLRTLQASDLLDYEAAEFGALLRRLLGLGAADKQGSFFGELLAGMSAVDPEHGLSLETIRAAAESVPNGKAAALLLIEHTWAIGLGEAILSAGGHLVAQGFLSRQAMLAAGQELETVVQAEVAIERAEALRGAALLDALVALAAGEQSGEAARSGGAEGDDGVSGARLETVARSVRALIVAGVLEDAAALEAVEALVAAGLIPHAALEQASRLVDSAAPELAGIG